MQNANQQTIDSFLLWLGGSRTKATVSSYKFAFYALKKWLKEENLPLLGCSVEDFSRYLMYLDTRGLKSGTRNLYATALRSMWSWLYRQGKVPWAPDLIPLPVKESTSHPAASEEEVSAILGCLDEAIPIDVRDKAVIMLFWKTGLRLGELLSLRVQDMDWKNCRGTVKTFKRKNHYRPIFWDGEMRDMFNKWLEVRKAVLWRKQIDSEYVFISLASNSEGGQMARHAPQMVMRKLCKQLGIRKRVTPHTLRHAFGHKGVEQGVHIRDLQNLLGHAKITTTQIYLGNDENRSEEVWRKNFARPLLIPKLLDE